MGNQKNVRKGSRSRRKTERKPRGRVVSLDIDSSKPSVQLELPIAEIVAGLQDSVQQFAIDAGLLVMNGLIEDELEKRVGKKGKHDPDRQARRHGYEEGYVAVAGKKNTMASPTTCKPMNAAIPR